MTYRLPCWTAAAAGKLASHHPRWDSSLAEGSQAKGNDTWRQQMEYVASHDGTPQHIPAPVSTNRWGRRLCVAVGFTGSPRVEQRIFGSLARFSDPAVWTTAHPSPQSHFTTTTTTATTAHTPIQQAVEASVPVTATQAPLPLDQRHNGVLAAGVAVLTRSRSNNSAGATVLILQLSQHGPLLAIYRRGQVPLQFSPGHLHQM